MSSKAKNVLKSINKILAVLLGVLLVVAGAMFYTKNMKEVDAAQDNASTKVAKATKTVATKDVVDAVDAINTTFAEHETPDEAKAYEGTDFTLPQLDPEDSVSKLDEFALGPISEEMLSPMRDWLGWEVDWSSYPVDPITDQPMTTTRVNWAKNAGYVDYTMSYATSFGFPKNWEDYRAQRGMPEDATEQEVVFRWIGDQTANYPAFLGMVELFGEAKTLGTKNRDISGNEFFNEILKLAAEAEMENKGVTKFLKDGVDPAYSQYNFDWQSYRAKFMIWLSQCDSAGRKNWWTREKSYLGPADGTAHDGVEYKFDYTRVSYIRPNFTTDKQRQTDLDSYVFCFKDKNGYRVSEWFGVNATNGDAELYTEGEPVKKKDITADSGYNPAKQPDGTVKVSTTKTTVEVVKPTPTPTPTPKPTPTPIPKPKKDKSKSSVTKKENIIDGKNPVGQGTDAFQHTKPAEPAATVPEAQHQPTPETQAILDNGGNKTTPGTEGPSLPNPGSTTQPSGGGPGYSDYTTTPGGVVVEDHHEDETHRIENETATTPPIETKPDPDNDGDSSQNTGMPSGFGF